MSNLIRVKEVQEILGCGIAQAYKEIRNLNNELKAKGYRTISGRVNEDYLRERFGIKKVSTTDDQIS